MNGADDLDDLRPTVSELDLSRPLRIHVVGVGGAGMRAIARVLVEMGHEVSGSDRTPSAHLEALAELGVVVHRGHAAEHVGDADLVTRSTAVGDENPEVTAARARRIPVRTRADVLAAISRVRPAILVAGTHGKTTTSSMLAVILDEAGRSPSFVIGSDVDRFGTGARWSGRGETVIEADESDGTFLALQGAHAIVTSLDPDHLEFFGSRDRLAAAFAAFVGGIEGVVAVCSDDPDTGPLLGLPGVVTYGTATGADLHLSGLELGRATTVAEMTWHGEQLGRHTIGLPGLHNARNAAGAAAVALSLGVDPAAVRAGLAGFGGVARRFEQRGSAAGVDFVDDYAHLPAEVEAAISAAKAGGHRRIVVAYQPHRFSRTEALGATFASSFEGADHLLLTGIYPSGESPRPGVTGRIVFDAVRDASPELSVTYCESLEEAEDHLVDVLEPGDLCLTLGAGDLTLMPDRVRSRVAAGLAEALRAEMPDSVVSLDEPIGARTTYRVGGRATVWVEAGSIADLRTVCAAARRVGLPVLPIGRGSNLLVADSGFDGVALGLSGEFERVVVDGTSVVAGAGVALPALARQTVAAGLTGFEWAVGVPGSIGGAVVMNAGGHGSDMAASVRWVDVLSLDTGAVERCTREQLAFGYRRSAIGPEQIVLSAELELDRGDPAEGAEALAEIVRWRRENQPGGQNAGSVFTNPDGESAGRLVDAAGAKGRRVGSAEVSTKHANFIQVDPDGAADDVFELMIAVADLVATQAGIELVPETRMIGFSPTWSERRGSP